MLHTLKRLNHRPKHHNPMESDETEKKTVKVIHCTKLGDPTTTDNLKIAHVPPITHLPTQRHVRIELRASALNFADLLQLQGLYQEKQSPPFIPGSEASGIVLQVGRDVRTVSVGDPVVAITQHAFASEIVADESTVIKLPPHLPEDELEAAAGMPVAFGTAVVALKYRAQLKPGQTVLIPGGAAGGVGLAAVQIAKQLGARVIAVVRGTPSSKIAALQEAGADIIIDSNNTNNSTVQSMIHVCKQYPADVVFDPVGGSALLDSLRCVKWGAQILLIGFASNNIPKLPANILLVKNLTVHGVFWGSYLKNDAALWRKSIEECAKMLGEGKIKVNVSHIYSFDQAKAAFLVLKSRLVVGKVLLLPNPRSML